MFVAALGNNTVEVLDLAKGVRARSLPGFHEPQGIVVLRDSNLVAVANGQSGDLVLLDARNGSVTRTIPLSNDADNVRYDAAARRPYVAHGGGAISAIDPATGQVLREVRLPGHPESFQLERNGHRIYVSCGEAFLDVFRQEDVSHFSRMAHVATAPGARTSLYVPEQNRLYLAVPHRAGQKAEVRVYDVRD